ncbi:hypothetical protein HZY86_04595 [Aerococcaceae bacterium DSM 111020]|nr:hypothetical protein [Aerococcaceae bacterium DSM 111020]
MTQNKWMQLQEFLNHYEELYENRDQAVEDFLRYFKGEPMQNSLIKMNQSMDKLEEAGQAPALIKKRALVQEAIDIWPDNLDALTYQAFIESDDNAFVLLDRLDKIGETFFQKKQEKIYESGFYDLENRSYFRLLKAQTTLCLDESFYMSGIDYASQALQLEPSDPLGFRYDLISFYVLIGDYKSARALFMEYGSDDTMLAFSVMTGAVLHRDIDYAKILLDELQKRCPDLYKLFSDDFMTKDSDMDSMFENDVMRVGTLDEIIFAMRPLLPLYYHSDALIRFVTENIKFPEEYSNNRDVETLSEYNWNEAFQKLYKECFAGIDQHRAYLIYKAGYDSIEKLQQATYKEITNIKGIGKATAEQLRENGFELD